MQLRIWEECLLQCHSSFVGAHLYSEHLNPSLLVGSGLKCLRCGELRRLFVGLLERGHFNQNKLVHWTSRLSADLKFPGRPFRPLQSHVPMKLSFVAAYAMRAPNKS